MGKIRNKTKSPQHIHYIDGSVFTVGIGNEFEIDESKMFPEEIKRIKSFFEFIAKEKKPVEIKPEPKYDFKRKKENDEGIVRATKKYENNEQGGTE
jgi:hypothetical protein